MGNYTGYRVSARLIPSTPNDVIQTLLDVIRENEPQQPVPQHRFFEERLWRGLFSGGSSYFSFSRDNQGQALSPVVMARARLGRGKTYRWELEAFGSTKEPSHAFALLLDWLSPWVEPQAYPVVVTQYEEDTCVPLPSAPLPDDEPVEFGFSPEYGAMARVFGVGEEGLWWGSAIGHLDRLVLPGLVGEEIIHQKPVVLP